MELRHREDGSLEYYWDKSSSCQVCECSQLPGKPTAIIYHGMKPNMRCHRHPMESTFSIPAVVYASTDSLPVLLNTKAEQNPPK